MTPTAKVPKLHFKRVKVRVTDRLSVTQYAAMIGGREIARIRSLGGIYWYATYNPKGDPTADNIDGISFADVKSRVALRALADGLL